MNKKGVAPLLIIAVIVAILFLLGVPTLTAWRLFLNPTTKLTGWQMAGILIFIVFLLRWIGGSNKK